MGDTAHLRTVLSQTDMSQPAIQSSAAAMMKFYDKNAAPLTVSEWRSQLQSCRPDQLLPLLYVANEVLQTSKRNRGPKFLEAFAEVLGSSLRFICERDRSIVEKVRRTAKIWGDRQVYSPRFVGQLLGGLEDLRGGGSSSGGGGPPLTSSALPSAASSAPAATTSTTAKRSVTDDEDDRPAPALRRLALALVLLRTRTRTMTTINSRRPSVPARANPSCPLIFPPRPRQRRADPPPNVAGAQHLPVPTTAVLRPLKRPRGADRPRRRR